VLGDAGELFKCFLGKAVEGERGYGAFETRSGQTPRAVGAAPAGEVVPFDPDQALTHTSPAFCVRLGLEQVLPLGRRRAEHIKSERGRWTPARRQRQSPMESAPGQVTKVLHLWTAEGRGSLSGYRTWKTWDAVLRSLGRVVCWPPSLDKPHAISTKSGAFGVSPSHFS